jgi:membrane protein implicated in regulation of membrane protease activity
LIVGIDETLERR